MIMKSRPGVAGLAFRTQKLALSVALILSAASASALTNGTMLQYFDGDSSSDGQHWNRVNSNAATWAGKGITAVWLPPAYKGQDGATDVGYGVYDLFDLGEFNQRGRVRTRWGTRGGIAGVQGYCAQPQAGGRCAGVGDCSAR